jgi:hypothetical protein
MTFVPRERSRAPVQPAMGTARREKTFEPFADLPYAFPTGGRDGG